MQRILWAVEFNWRGTNSSPHNRCSDLALGRVWEKVKRSAGSETCSETWIFEILCMTGDGDGWVREREGVEVVW